MMDDTDFYGVGLLNDQTHSFNYVIEMLVKLCGVTPEQGLSMAREIDRNGKAIVFSGTRGECENMLRLVSEYGPDPLLPNSNGPIAGYIERNAKPNNVTKQAGNQVGVILALLCFVVPIGAFFAVGIFVGRSKEAVEPVNQPGPSAVGLDELRKKPVTISKDEIGDLLTKWWEEGTAAGNVGDFYDNRDDEHSDFKTDEFPQLRRILYSSDDVKNRRNWALTLNVRPHVTFGNSSTAAPTNKSGSNGRNAYCKPGGIALLAQQYSGNNVYIYPACGDHVPRNKEYDFGDGDLFPTNTPYLLISQGASSSDQPFMRAVCVTLAAFRPEVKQRLVEHGLLMPTLQMIMRSTNKQLGKSEDYLTEKAHPTVFQGSSLDPLRMIKFAHDITLDTVPPSVRLQVIEEEIPQNGRDFFEPHGVTEELASTPEVIARIWRSKSGRRRMVVSAADSVDLNMRPLTFTWVVFAVMRSKSKSRRATRQA